MVFIAASRALPLITWPYLISLEEKLRHGYAFCCALWMVWALDRFLALEEGPWLQSLAVHHQICMLEPPSASQLKAWQHCFSVLQRECRTLTGQRPSAAQWTLIFEYELPRERGRRPDVVLLADSMVIVLEFKEHAIPLQAHLDQAAAYARDLYRFA